MLHSLAMTNMTKSHAGFAGLERFQGFGKLVTEQTRTQAALAKQQDSEESAASASQQDTASFSGAALAKMAQTASATSSTSNASNSFSDKNGVYTAKHDSARHGSTTVTQTMTASGKAKDASYSLEFELKDGKSVKVGIKDDVTMSRNIDGTTSLYFADKNMTHTYGEDGSITKQTGNTLTASADTSVVNISGKDIKTGSGDDVIFNFSDHADIATGYGSDTVFMRGKNVDLHLGYDKIDLDKDGKEVLKDDKVFAQAIESGSIRGGAAEISIEADSINNSYITLGSGFNTLSVAETVGDTSIKLGDRQNDVTLGSLLDSTFKLGGINTAEDKNLSSNYVNIEKVENSSLELGDMESGSLSKHWLNIDELKNSDVLLNGHTNASIENIKASSIDIPDDGITEEIPDAAKNLPLALIPVTQKSPFLNLNAETITDSSFALNEGDNEILARDIKGSSISAIGESNNTIHAQSIAGSSLDLGDGDNVVGAKQVMMTDINLGDGNNTLDVEQFLLSSFNAGNGNNTLNVDQLIASSLELGDGNNAIDVGESVLSSIQVGEGTNKIDIQLFNQSALETGAGNNTVQIEERQNSDTYSAKELARIHNTYTSAIQKDIDNAANMDALFANETLKNQQTERKDFMLAV